MFKVVIREYIYCLPFHPVDSNPARTGIIGRR
jgi:hypothetical protein